MFQIEKNIPIPPSKTAKSSKWEFLLELQPGDSFLISENGSSLKLAAAAQNFARIRNVKVTTRRVGDAVRVWRLS